MDEKIKQICSTISMSFFFVGAFALWSVSFSPMNQKGIIVSIVHADDGEDYGDEGDDDYSSSETVSTKQKTVKAKPVYETVLVEKVITTLDPIFTIDTDKDGLVDGLDPHPTVPESEYFTDDDNDGIANAFDMHIGEDDFAYYEQENDENGNGILDSYEAMASN